MEIVGVVKDTQYSQVRPGEIDDAGAQSLRIPTEGVPRVVYTPYQQSTELGEMTVYLRATPASAGALPALARQAVQRADRDPAGLRPDDDGGDGRRVAGRGADAGAALDAVRRDWRPCSPPSASTA